MRKAGLRYYKKRRKLGLSSFLKGRKMSDEAREHMREAQLQSKSNRRSLGIPHPLAGRIVPEDVKERMRAGHIGRHATGPRVPRWKGGRKKNGDYYMLLQPHHPAANPNGYVLEHRLVMEKKLGRFLRPEEVVHHINGKGRDNRNENFASSRIMRRILDSMRSWHPQPAIDDRFGFAEEAFQSRTHRPLLPFGKYSSSRTDGGGYHPRRDRRGG